MSLRKALEQKRDELGAKVLADHANGKPYCADFFTAGADAMLNLLWDCVDTLEAIRDEGSPMDASVALAALTALRAKIEGGGE